MNSKIVKPSFQDNGIIRPIAFRPLNQGKDEHKSARENSRSIGNLVLASTSTVPSTRTRPSTSSTSSSTLFPLVNSSSTSKLHSTPEDNDYDTVPEFVENRKNESNDPTTDNYSLIYNFQQTAGQQHRRAPSGTSSAGSSAGNHFNGFHGMMGQTNASLTSSNSSSTTTSGLPNSPPHSAGSSVKKSSSRHSGLHITPSPSDSGIVDYEVCFYYKIISQIERIRSITRFQTQLSKFKISRSHFYNDALSHKKRVWL